MSFKHLLKGILRTGFAAAELGVKAAKTAKSAVETAIAEAKAEEERKRAAEAEAKRKAAEAEAKRRAAEARRAREEAEAEAKRKAEERARQEAERQKREAALVAAVLATTEALGIASAKPPAKQTGGKRTAGKASAKKAGTGKTTAKKTASKAPRKTARENAALAARPEPEARPYEPAWQNRRYAKYQGDFNANSGLARIREQILRIVNAEGPISETTLLVRVLDEWGFTDLDNLRYRIVRMAVPDALPVTDRLGVPVYWPVGVGPGDWNCYRCPAGANRPQRVFATIPLEEIAAAIVAEHHASSGDRPIDDYVPGALERLGLSRDVSPDMGEALEVAKRLAQGIDDRPPANTSVPDEWNEAAAKAEEAERRKKEAEEAERRKKEAEEAERRKKEAERRKKEEEAKRLRIEAEKWSRLVSEESGMFKRNKWKGWSDISSGDWSRILARHPEYADKCDKWNQFDSYDWGTILYSQPQFADKCDKWENFDSVHWLVVLRSQPQFADKCDWSKLDDNDWDELLEKQPQLAKYRPRKLSSAERGIAALGSASFWEAVAAGKLSESDEDGEDPPPSDDF